MAYGSALGSLEAHEAVEPLLTLLETTQNEGARLEIAMSLVRMVQSVQAIRQFVQTTQVGTTTSVTSY